MKKILILLAVLLVFLCGCSTKAGTEDDNSFTVATFSYEADRANYENKPGVKTSGFRNTEKRNITGAEQLLELAEDECTIDFDTITMSIDSEAQIYKFTFSTEEAEEPYNSVLDVYISKDGVTQMTVCWEKE